MSHVLDSTQVRVVKASAGSGKTYALARRYVQILLLSSTQTPQSLKHILAITFTNKAATQMKERIIALVKRIALDQLTDAQVDDILKPIGMTRAQALKAAGVVMDDIIRYYHYFNVSTIDSFMNTLLSGCAFKMNLSARFKIKRNAAQYLLLSLDALIDQGAKDKDTRILFERFIMQYLFLENRSNWFPKQDLMDVMLILFKQQNTYQRPLLKFDVSDKDIHSLKRRFIDLVGDLCPLLPQGVDKRFVSALQDFHTEHPKGFDVDHLSRYFGRTEIPIKDPSALSGQCVQLWENITSTLHKIVLCEAYAVFNPYVDLFEALMVILEETQVKEDILFLEQLNKKAGELFAHELVSVAEVYYRLATRFNHYLMDEFQDTAQAQWQNIKPLVEEALASGGSLFYVGDKKQAIYGFRGGLSRLFDQLPMELSAFSVGHQSLDTNYRSSRQIVEFNNAVFAHDNLMRMVGDLEVQDRFKDKDIAFSLEDKAAIKEVFDGATQNSKDNALSGYIHVETVYGKKKEERNEQIRVKVLDAIHHARQRFALNDIALLTRNNSEVEEVTGWLLSAGVPAQSERTSDIKNHWLIKQLMAMLRFLDDPSDNTAFVDFITSDIYLKATGINLREMEDFLFQHRPDKKAMLTHVYHQHFKAQYSDAWEKYFTVFLHQVGVYPLYETVLNICQKFNVLSIFPQEQGFIMHWLELIKVYEEEGCDLRGFINYFDALEDQSRFVPMPSIEAVQVLTIHKSKGLEFGCVIIPFLEMTIKVGSGDKSGGQSFLWDETPEGLRLFRLKENYTLFCDLLKDRYAVEYKQSFKQELNNMYVALTRAVDEMIVFIPERVGNSINPALSLIPEAWHHVGTPKNNAVHAPVVRISTPLALATFKDWAQGWSEELALPSLENQELRRQGEIIHFCLSQIQTIHGLDVREVVATAVTKADRQYALMEGRALYEDKILALLALPAWQQYFDIPASVTVLCEQEIVNQYGDTRRIDRLIIDNNRVCAIDFKPNENLAAYQDQMNTYVQLLKALYPKAKVEGVVLTYGL